MVISRSRLAVLAVLFLGLLFAGAAAACDYCGRDAVYSCSEGRYDCHYESSLYIPRDTGCADGCGGYRGGCYSECGYNHRGCNDGCYRRPCDRCGNAYVRGFGDGYRSARFDRDGWHDGDRDSWHDGQDPHDWHDGDRWRDDHDGHDRDREGDDRAYDHDWHDH